MYTFLLIILIIHAIVLAAAVLMQAGKGGGLAASFGGASSSTELFLGSRQAGNILTKASWWGGGLFIFLAFVLQLMSTSSTGGPRSILDQALTPGAPTTQQAPQTAVPLQDAPPSTPNTTPPPQP